MLILQRKASQSLMIGDDIKISIVEINADRVKIAIDAPKDISILRTELIEAAGSNREAAKISEEGMDALKKMLKKNK